MLWPGVGFVREGIPLERFQPGELPEWDQARILSAEYERYFEMLPTPMGEKQG